MAHISNDSVKINYEVEGNGDCLVLEHGFLGSIEDWYEYGYVEALKKNYKLILIDARGHGKSDKPDQAKEYSLYLRSQDVIKVLDAEKIDRCHFMGYSMGGWISFGLMKWFKQRFHSFILDAIHPYVNDMLSMRNLVRTLDEWAPDHNVSPGKIQRLLANNRQALLAAVEEARTDHSDVLKSMTLPCLLLAGENDEMYKKIKESSKLFPMLKFVTIPEADHWQSLYKSEFIIPQIEEFLQTIKMS
ncbi:putative hydrolase or acyltransferase of alpha/beta superfamily [Desulfosporosinus orientis DSM 765]|uniref:Putative hydrolase or acyltransferase of alpha/beta superfamily n=1 Tax=Desulfosporosinus orientis (strain ATCC 19365 / DSM 765 / NCIMB 8382 / VKM B-1628 / Singapore I) TaxID=768706 RepID=G7WFZ9_DESOD|nr:alpha/beta fold hydrolase [Desulfosporosinus orientis]AET69514.1 putative hydrolase or acyltransferase of alpha/beta superfamily [Desulfosporosinus orientis DSM 765]